MVWQGLTRCEAAQAAGLQDESLRIALAKPHVIAALRREMEVLRLSERPRNIHRLAQIRDAADNMPAVNAIKALEEIDDIAARAATSLQRAPGLQIVIMPAATPQPPVIDAKPVDVTD
jgi:hypothetical protein